MGTNKQNYERHICSNCGKSYTEDKNETDIDTEATANGFDLNTCVYVCHACYVPLMMLRHATSN